MSRTLRRKMDDETSHAHESLSQSRVDMIQVRANLWKHGLTKWRAPKSTVCEAFAPLLLLALLVWGFNQSAVIHFQVSSAPDP